MPRLIPGGLRLQDVLDYLQNTGALNKYYDQDLDGYVDYAENSDKLDGYDHTDFVKKAGDVMTGDLEVQAIVNITLGGVLQIGSVTVIDASRYFYPARLYFGSYYLDQLVANNKVPDSDKVDGIDLPNTTATVLTDHNKALHDALGIDHGSLSGLGDDDHPQYYNSARHTKAVHDALGIDADTVDGKHASDLETSNLQNVTSSRALDTVYQNTTGRYLLVIVAIYDYDTNAHSSLGQISPDNTTWYTQSRADYQGGATAYDRDGSTHVLIVPNGYYYKVTSGGYGLTAWWEVEI